MCNFGKIFIWCCRLHGATKIPGTLNNYPPMFTIGLAAFQDVICNDSMFVVILCHPLSILQYMLSTEIGVKIFLDQNILYAILSLCWLPIIQSIKFSSQRWYILLALVILILFSFLVMVVSGIADYLAPRCFL